MALPPHREAAGDATSSLSRQVDVGSAVVLTPPTRERVPPAAAAAASSTSQPPVPHVLAPRRAFPRARPRPLRPHPPLRPRPRRCSPAAVPRVRVRPRRHNPALPCVPRVRRDASVVAPPTRSPTRSPARHPSPPPPRPRRFPETPPSVASAFVWNGAPPRPVIPPPPRRRLLKVATPATARRGHVRGRDVLRGRPVESPRSRMRVSRYPSPLPRPSPQRRGHADVVGEVTIVDDVPIVRLLLVLIASKKYAPEPPSRRSTHPGRRLDPGRRLKR